MAAKGKRRPEADRHEESIDIDFPGIDDVLGTAGAWTGLLSEARLALDVGPPIASLYHDDVADAHWKYLASLGERCKSIASKLGIDVHRRFKLGKEEFTWDFGVEDHKTIEARYHTNVSYLTSRGLFLPPWNKPMALAAGLAMPGWLTKLLSLLGVEAEDLEVVGEAFSEEFGDDLLDEIKDLFSEAFEDVQEGKWSEAEKKLAEAVKKLARFLERLVERLDDFLEKLVRKWIARIGRTGAARKAAEIGGKIASKVVPGIGWFIFLLELLWLLMKNLGIIYV